MSKRPRVLVALTVLTERNGWINPGLMMDLLDMQVDRCYEVKIALVKDAWPIDYARNVAVTMARDGGFDWLLMVDADQYFYADGDGPLSILSRAPADAFIIGFPTRIGSGGINVCTTES